MSFFSFLSSLVFLQIEREREGVYNWVLGETVLKFTYLYDDFPLESIFLFLRVDGIYFIFSSGLKVWVLLVQNTFRPPPVISAVVSIYLIISTTVPQIPVLMLHPEFGIRSIHHDLCPKTDFLFPYFR